jgi:hypothetical protein
VIRILPPGGGTAGRQWRAITICSSLALASLALAVGNVHMVAPAAFSLPAAVRPVAVEDFSTAVVPRLPPTAQETSVVASAASRRLRSREGVKSAKAGNDALAVAASEVGAQARSRTAAAGVALPSRSLGWPVDLPAASTVVTPAAEAPVDAPPETASVPHDPGTSASYDDPRKPWTAAADAAVAIGRGSQNAGVATAGFFNRFGRRIASAF